jgi:hypothetical protein
MFIVESLQLAMRESPHGFSWQSYQGWFVCILVAQEKIEKPQHYGLSDSLTVRK